jgi:hypothetical protein
MAPMPQGEEYEMQKLSRGDQSGGFPKKVRWVWRRRECPACKVRFNTLEMMDSGRPEVRKPKVAKPKVRKRVVVTWIAVDRFVGNLGAIAQMKPDVIDKFDSDS